MLSPAWLLFRLLALLTFGRASGFPPPLVTHRKHAQLRPASVCTSLQKRNNGRPYAAHNLGNQACVPRQEKGRVRLVQCGQRLVRCMAPRKEFRTLGFYIPPRWCTFYP